MNSSSLGIYVTAVYVATYAVLFGYTAYLLWRRSEVGGED
ncbi:hypothetical protein Ocepr_0636 [Oceanithermus profundus DSM 14977]|uniref:Uncharacterized protein n=1 Tax=Oceanithermus profundus (strain DSM 14977 / NBRC 100410 / VKM B-2274 / 506) TaxID=670487 RepID=E4U804_OCEP5|nr:hypothetical protein Ocepr_0636 [Oceanithermus profundus DSM 14977]